MKEADLPIFASSILQLLFQPGDLIGIHVIAVEGKEADRGERFDVADLMEQVRTEQCSPRFFRGGRRRGVC